MDTPRTLQVLTNARGRILGAGFTTPAPSGDDEVQVSVTPLKGQSLAEVPLPRGFTLETDDDFRALVATYRMEKGKKALSKKRSKR
jgi:hypothetical protein